MTTTGTWQQLAPERGALARLAPIDDDVWVERLRFDRERAARHQSRAHMAISESVRERAEAVGAEAVVLSGSTARGHRTQVSDLDYHVIGASSIQVADLPEDIDLYADEVDRFWSKLREGDDFSHWSVWYGCVLYDRGVIRGATAFVAESDAWPDPGRKLRQARSALDFAGQIAESGDYGAALEQARGALSLLSRWLLLSHDVFPLARDELSGQLEQLGHVRLACDLRRTIRERPSAGDLRVAIADAQAISQADRSAIRRAAA